MRGLEIILGMDWLHSHKVTIDCANKTIQVPERGYEVYYSHHPTFDEDNLAEYDDGPRFIILCLESSKVIHDIDSIPIVRNYPEV
jgi:hypothetical protein